MIRYLLIALLLIPTLASAGQGMGPGPGIYYAKVMPPAQVALTALTDSPAQLTVTWGAVSGATSYNVYYSISNNSSGATKITAATTGTSYTIASGLSGGTTYYVWVSAQKNTLEGALSTPLSAAAAGGAMAMSTVTINQTVNAGNAPAITGSVTSSATGTFTLAGTYDGTDWYNGGDAYRGGWCELHDALDNIVFTVPLQEGSSGSFSSVTDTTLPAGTYTWSIGLDGDNGYGSSDPGAGYVTLSTITYMH